MTASETIASASNVSEAVGFVFSYWGMMLLGQAMHLLKKFVELEDVNGPSAAWGWVKGHPFTIVYSLLAGVIATALLIAMNQINLTSALACGYMADSIVNSLLSKAQKRIENAPDEKLP